MRYNIQSKVLHERRLILKYFSGQIMYEDILLYISKLCEDLDFNASFNLLIDIQDAHFKLHENQIRDLYSLYRETNKSLNPRNIAILTKSPNQVVIAMLLEKYIPVPIRTDIFSTLPQAIQYVSLTIEELPLIENEIHKLRYKVLSQV